MKPRKASICISLPTDMIDTLDQLALEQGVPLSHLVREAILRCPARMVAPRPDLAAHGAPGQVLEASDQPRLEHS